MNKIEISKNELGKVLNYINASLTSLTQSSLPPQIVLESVRGYLISARELLLIDFPLGSFYEENPASFFPSK